MKDVPHIEAPAFSRGDDTHYAPALPVHRVNGVTYGPANGISIATFGNMDGADTNFVGVLMRADEIGLVINLTSIGARAVGESLIASADKMEAEAQYLADAALVRAAARNADGNAAADKGDPA